MSDSRARDRAARLAAVSEFAHPMVLEAGAGTGKTAVLVERVVTWCVGPGFDRALGETAASDGDRVAEEVLEGVVALTFSEAAAAEMQERITGRLSDVAGNGVPLASLEDVPEVLRSQRAKALLSNLDRLVVRTIHAFCRRILARFPIEAGLHPRFSVDARAELRSRVAREEIETVLRDAESRAALRTLSERSVVAPDLERLMLALLGGGVRPEAFAADPFTGDALQGFRERLVELLEVIGTPGVPQSSAELKLSQATAGTRRWLADTMPRNAEELAAGIETLRKLWEPAEAALRAGAARDPALAALRGFLSVAFRLHPDLLAPLHELLAPSLARADQRLRAAGGVTFDALLQRTRDLLRDHAEVAGLVRRGIQQLLVDEFQDTDPLQCEIVAELALAGPSETRPTLFVVGDPKQSIYGWRNADLAAYDDFKTQAMRCGAVCHELVVNYRSTAALLREVERAVTPIMQREPGIQPAFAALLPSGAAGAVEIGPAVEYWISSSLERQAGDGARARDLEARSIADDLVRSREQAQIPWHAAAILLRSTGDLEHYLEALRRRQIPFAVDRDRIYYRRREVLEAAALLRCVIDPNDQLALVATLRSVRCGVPDAAWLPLWRAGFPGALRRALLVGGSNPAAGLADVVAAIRTAAREVAGFDLPELAPLSDWAEALEDFASLLLALRHSYRSEPFDRFLDRARRLTLFDPTEGARHLGAHRLANLDRFFRELAHRDDVVDGASAELLRFLRRGEPAEPDFDEGRPRDVTRDAVVVTTIHGAKGLAFDCVYLAQAHKASARQQLDPVDAGRVGERVEYQLRWGPGRRQGAGTLGFDGIARRRERVARAELVRTLYVAMTRARKRLVIAGRLDAGSPDRGETHADLLARSIGPELAKARALASQRREAEVTLSSRHFRFLALAAGEAQRASPSRRSAPSADVAGQARRAADRMAALRAAASARAARPVSEAPSAAATRDRATDVDVRRAPSAPSGQWETRTGVGARVGSAVHQFLETFDWDGDEAQSWAQQWERTRIRLLAEPAGTERDETLARAEALLSALRSGPLWSRLREIAPFVMGREVPLLAPPESEEDGPVAYRAGAIDLLYRDPQSGEVVVADFKTDRVQGRAERAANGYRSQGALYCSAVADALGSTVPPRFELWFLAAQKIVVLN